MQLLPAITNMNQRGQEYGETYYHIIEFTKCPTTREGKKRKLGERAFGIPCTYLNNRKQTLAQQLFN